MPRIAVSALLLVVLIGGNALAKPGIVKTNNGQTYEGEIDEHDPASVIIIVRGIQTKIDRGQVASITYSGDKLQELQARQAKLDPKDVPGRVALAREAMAQQQYAFARDVLEEARLLDPNNAEVVSLSETVQSQLRMQRNTQRPPEEPRPATATPTTGAPATTAYAGDVKLLRPTEINAIRQAETRWPDDPVRVRFEHNVRQRFVEFMGKDQVPNFYQLNPGQQAKKILDEGPREMWQDVTVLNDPPALQWYRQKVQSFVVTNCATTACHGGSGAKFKIITPADSDAASYTNFYTLAKYIRPAGAAASGGSPFGQPNPRTIDRQRPEMALLLQYSLPGNLSDFDHPDVRDFHPPLKNKTDAKYRLLYDWMTSQLKPVDPTYSFESPVTQPATQPASEPAASSPAAAAPPPARPAARPAAVPPPPPGGILR